MGKPFQFVQSEYYSNILMLSDEGNPLSTVSAKRANWYLSRGLATELGSREGFSKVIRLNFRPADDTPKMVENLANRCVVCGCQSNLSLHHVIPICIKRLFPKNKKEHTMQWCVLVCSKHHFQAEKVARPHYEIQLQKALGAAQKNHFHEHIAFHKSHGMSKSGFSVERIFEKLSEEQKVSLESIVGLRRESISNKILEKCAKRLKLESVAKVNEAKEEWIKAFIEQCGGVEGVAELFKIEFLKLEPKFLPDNYIQKI